MLWARAMDISRIPKRKTEKKQFLMWKNRGSVGADLDHLDAERAISTDPDDNRKRRTLQLHKLNDSWGFTLQTYGIKHKKTNEIDLMTYVDYVDLHGAAYMAGLRKGDVIVSVNGKGVELSTHQELVQMIKTSGESMRLVVLFEDCCKKVELYDRIIKLKNVLSYKVQELRMLETQEREILDGICEAHNLNRFDLIRQSVYSQASSNSWDDISIINSPHTLRHLPNSWATSCSSDITFTPKSSIGEEDNSVDEPIDFDDSYIDITYADSDSDSGACINDDSFEINQSRNRKDKTNQSDCDANNIDQSEIRNSSNQGSDEVFVCDTENSKGNLQVQHHFEVEIHEHHIESGLNSDEICNKVLESCIKTEDSSEIDKGESSINSQDSNYDRYIEEKSDIPFLFHGDIYINQEDENTKL